jgi:hypothetical protein
MKSKIIGYYSIFLFIAITGYWIITLKGHGYSEGKIEITFHVFSELLMAFICLISGLLILLNQSMGRKLNIVGLSMILYSVLNAAGYFGQHNEWKMAIMFLALFILSLTVLTMLLFKNS